jgi:hypothetical protein
MPARPISIPSSAGEQRPAMAAGHIIKRPYLEKIGPAGSGDKNHPI